MKKDSCLQNIRDSLRDLTESETKVAHYILEHHMDVLNASISELAESAQVSVATVVRFCKSLGYKGYQDMKIQLAQDSIAPYKHLNPVLEKDDSPSQIAEKIIRSEIDTLEETLNVLDMKELEQTAGVLRDARRIVFFGSGGSSAVAYDAMHKLLKVGIRSTVYLDADVQSMESALMRPGDVAFGISHSGTNWHVIECLENARRCGAAIVGLTTYGDSPLRRVCDHILTTATKQTVFKSESVTARTAQLAVLDALAAILSFMDYDGAYEAIQKTRQATSGGKY